MQFFLLMGAAYLAPNVSPAVRVVAAMICLIMATLVGLKPFV